MTNNYSGLKFPIMDIEAVIKHYGKTTDVCDALGVTRAAISQWRDTGIPPMRQYQIEALTKGKFKVKRNNKQAA